MLDSASFCKVLALLRVGVVDFGGSYRENDFEEGGRGGRPPSKEKELVMAAKGSMMDSKSVSSTSSQRRLCTMEDSLLDMFL